MTEPLALTDADLAGKSSYELAALPAELQAFWVTFRAAVAARSADKLTALAGLPLKSNLRTGDDEALDKAELAKSVERLFPNVALEVIKQSVPACEAAGSMCRVFTPPVSDADKVGRVYVFNRAAKTGAWAWTGVFVNAD